MLYFPQLATGATAQFPLIRRKKTRTVVNRLEDGREIRMADGEGGGTEWELTLVGLSDAERQAIEELFRATEGRARTFTFADPAANLLRWSEDLGAAEWTRGPLLSLTSGVQDPAGTFRATKITNAGQAAQRIVQTLDVPGDLWYCLSATVRCAGEGQIGLVRGDCTDWHSAGTAWQRISATGNRAGNGDEIAFGIELPAGVTADVFGLQVEAQPEASGYKPTSGETRVHRVRFGEDRLQFVADGPGSYTTKLRLISGD